MIINDPMPYLGKLRDGAGMGNAMQMQAYRKLRVGKNYKVPVKNTVPKDDAAPINMSCLCIGKYPHHAVFQNKKGINISYKYLDIAKLILNIGGDITKTQGER